MARKCVHETFKSEDQILWLSLNFQVASSAYHLHGRTRHSIWKTSENVGLEGGGEGEAMFVLFSVCFPFMGVACEQALRGRAGREKEGELANTSLEFEFHLQFPCGSPSTELSHFHQSRRSRNECKINVNKHWKTHAKGNDVVTVISTNQHFALTFLIQVFKFQRHSCKLSFPFLPRPGEFAHRLL